jgi:SAM-dependent methyltransferase
LPDASIDLAVSSRHDSLPADLEPFLREIRRVLRPQGLALLAISSEDKSEPRLAASTVWRQPFERQFRQVRVLGLRQVKGSLAAPLQPEAAPGSLLFFLANDQHLLIENQLAAAQGLILLATNREQAVELPVSMLEWVEDRMGPPPRYADLQAQLDSVVNSRSWKLTAPLRRITAWFRGRRP